MYTCRIQKKGTEEPICKAEVETEKQSCFRVFCHFLLYNKVNQPHAYIYIFSFFEFPPHSRQHRTLGRIPCVLQQVLSSCQLFPQQYTCVNPNFPIHPTPFQPPLGSIWLFSTSVSLFLLYKQAHQYPFSRFYIYTLIQGYSW